MVTNSLQQPENTIPAPTPPPMPASTPPVSSLPPVPSAPAPSQVSSSSNTAQTLLDVLVMQGSLKKEQVDELRVKSATTGKPTDVVLEESHMVSEENIAKA